MNPSPGPDPTDAFHRRDPAELDVAWPATAQMLIHVRRCIADWLHSRKWPAAAVDEIEHAVNEAATNVVEHAYPPGHRAGLIELCAWTYREMFPPRVERAVVTITDTGQGLVCPAHIGGRPSHTHTHGFTIIKALTHEHYIQSTDAGTRIVLISHARPFSEPTAPRPGAERRV